MLSAECSKNASDHNLDLSLGNSTSKPSGQDCGVDWRRRGLMRPEHLSSIGTEINYSQSRRTDIGYNETETLQLLSQKHLNSPAAASHRFVQFGKTNHLQPHMPQMFNSSFNSSQNYQSNHNRHHQYPSGSINNNNNNTIGRGGGGGEVVSCVARNEEQWQMNENPIMFASAAASSGFPQAQIHWLHKSGIHPPIRPS